MLKSILGQILIDLGELEGDYRVFHLKADIAQSTLSLLIANISVISMLRLDVLLFSGRPDLLTWLVLYRVIFVVPTIAIMLIIHRVERVRVFDKLMLGWLSFAVLHLLLFNFTRPVNYFTVAFDIIIPFAIYILSPLKISSNFALAFGYTVGTIYIDLFFKTNMTPAALNVAIYAQVLAHALGLASALQTHSYRRRSFKAYVSEKDAKEIATYLSNIDPLTESLTRRHFFMIANSEFLRFARYKRPLSVLVMDADRFKTINDTYGHHGGDIVLKSLSLVVLEQKRVQDIFGRLGGEEFGLLLPETNLEKARIVAERIQKTWEQTPSIMDGEKIPCTVSIGVAETAPGDTSFDDVLRRADRMMYKAKVSGRNQVVAN